MFICVLFIKGCIIKFRIHITKRYEYLSTKQISLLTQISLAIFYNNYYCSFFAQNYDFYKYCDKIWRSFSSPTILFITKL